MKRKLIEISQEHVVVCDKPGCGFTIPLNDVTKIIPLIEFVNTACPDCGENLLTVQDYLQAEKMLKVVNWINRWFSWITIFYSKNAKRTNVMVHCHDGIKIKKEPDPETTL